jgi:acyl-ACP thioesterase
VRWYRIAVLAPFLDDRAVDLATWCSAEASHAAGRRTTLRGDRGGHVEADSTWIHLDPAGRPARLEGFGVYSAATGGRRASTRLTLLDPPSNATRTPWQLRLVDADRMGHVNNAVFFAAVEERLPALCVDPRRPHRVLLEFRRPIDVGDAVELVDVVTDGWTGMSFVANGDVRAVARLEQR